VVELQHSAISPEDIRKRETFYREHAPGIVWIFDYTDRPAEWQTRRDLRLDHSTGSRLVDLGDGLAGHVVGLAGQHRDGNGARMSFGGWSLAEAPCGTGKSLAYLVPGLIAVLRARLAKPDSKACVLVRGILLVKILN
jgi:Rad3-related DNA helicase